MASQSAADRTEKATPKRRQEARKEGQVARSLEINSAMAMLAGFSILGLWGPQAFRQMSDEMRRAIDESTSQVLTVETVMDIFIHSVTVMAKAGAPFLVGLALTGIVANLLQVQFKFTPQVIKPRFSKLNPRQGFKRLLGVQSLVELAKNLFKLVVVGGPAAWTLISYKRDLMILTSVDPMTAGQVTMKLISIIGFQVAAIYIALAIGDYIWQRHSYEKRIRMTKQEVKQEQRQQDVAPELKMAQRRRQRDSARRRMLSDVPQADVIITNPTHFSIALKYDPEEGAPRVVAKGADLLAKRIREIAAENNVPRVENKPLARALYAETEIGQFIPPQMFAAVAEVLAFVYQTQRNGRGWQAERRLEHA